MPVASLLLTLPDEMKKLLLDFLNEDLINIKFSDINGILSLRRLNKYFYNFINSYFSDKYSIKQIVCGDHNTYILLENGDLYGCGANGAKSWLECIQPVNHFRLGLDDSIKKSEKFVKIYQNVKKIFGGGQEILLVLINDKTVYGIGNTHHLGLNSSQAQLTKQSAYDNGTVTLRGVMLRSTGQDFRYNYTEDFKQIASNLNLSIQDISVSRDHVILLDKSGKVYACGFNGYGKLGIGVEDNLEEFTLIFDGAEKVFATDFNTFITSNDGRLYAAGRNYYQFISYRFIKDEFIKNLMPIDHVFEPKLLKKIDLCFLGCLFLYENGDLYLNIMPTNKKGLLDTNVDKFIVYFQIDLLLFKKDGSLLFLRLSPNSLEENLHVLDIDSKNKFSIGQSLNFTLAWTANISFFPWMLANWIGPKITQYHSVVVKESNQITYLSDFYRSNRLFAYDSNSTDPLTPKPWGRFLFFFNNHNKKLYASGYDCTDGQLALPVSHTNGFMEVFDNLPIKNKLLQGRALKPTL